jgi:hypothetical protein
MVTVMFNTTALQTVMYEIATRTLPRVCLKEKQGVIGLILQEDKIAATVQVHWGVADFKAIQTWHKKDELTRVYMQLGTGKMVLVDWEEGLPTIELEG